MSLLAERIEERVRATVPEREMNRLEAAYAQELDLRKRVGEIIWYGFETVKIRLADRTYYSPDFAVVLKDGTLEIHEVKGFMRDDANVKLKCAAETFPAIFRLVRRERGQWNITKI